MDCFWILKKAHKELKFFTDYAYIVLVDLKLLFIYHLSERAKDNSDWTGILKLMRKN